VFNPCKPPFDNLLLRRALAHGLDFKDIMAACGFTWHSSGGLVPPGMPGHSPELGLSFNLPLARSLLSEAGFPQGRGFPILKFGFGVKHGGMEEIFRQLHEHLGIRCEYIETTGELEPGIISDLNLILTSWVADYPDPNNFLSQSNVINNLRDAGWKHSHYDQLIEQARKSMDQVQRMACYREADRILVDDETLIMPLASGRRWGVDLIQPWVSGWESGASTIMHYKYLRLERGR
jgi:oligopeptide transport system substrate-binding protein